MVLWLTKRREEIGLSQEDLATRLQLEGFNYQRATVSHWETGRHTIPLTDKKFRIALAKSLKISVYSLLVLADYEVIQQPYTHAGAQAAYIVDQLTPSEQELAIRLLKQLLK